MFNAPPKRIPNMSRHRSSRIEGFLFAIIILFEAGIFFYLILSQRVVGGHDGFNFFTMQYYLLNNVVNYGDIPQWSPFMMHGTLFTFAYVLLGGILPNILYLFGGLCKSLNFLPIFYAGMFVNELILLVGVWLLGKRFFASPFTVFFVSLSIMGSCIWFLQPLFNFHFYYAIPLILYLIHIFLDSGKWRFCFLAGNLLIMQFFGNLHYAFPVTSLVIFLYFFFYFVCNYEDMWKKIKTINLGWPFVFTTLFIIASFAFLYGFLSLGTNQLATYAASRSPDGSVTLDQFLTYGGAFKWQAWLELFLGISPCADYTLYIGILCAPFILLGLIFYFNKVNTHFFLTVIILLLFSMGTFVSIIFYYTWPMMDYYRHLVAVSPIIKVFLCFLAGFGVEAVLFNRSDLKNSLIIRASLVVMSILMLTASFWLFFLSDNYGAFADIIRIMVPKFHPVFLFLFNEELASFLLNRTALFALTAAVLFLVLCFSKQGKRVFLFLVTSLLVLHFADMYTFKFSEIEMKTVPLDDEIYQILEFQPMPYAKRRDISFEKNNPRAELLKVMPVVTDSGLFYWTINAFLFKEQLGNSFRTDFWMLPLDNYMKAYWGQSIHDLSIRPRGLYYRSGSEYPRMVFPKRHPAILKISGVTEDKIQFFSQAEILSSDDKIVSNITSADYKGDLIFLSPLEESKGMESVSASHVRENDLSSSTRLRLDYQVKHFDSNNLEITAQLNELESAWLLYSDVWHPFWRATVNGKEVPVYKANLAYKAIKLEKGFNEVHFYFKSELVSLFHVIAGINSLFWLFVILFISGKIVCRQTWGGWGACGASSNSGEA